jgi:hypothetical protein
VSGELPARIEPSESREIAADLASARPQQLVAVDNKGRVMSPARYRRQMLAWYTYLVGLTALLGAYAWWLLGLAGLVGVAPFALWAGHVVWRGKQLKHAGLLVQDMRLDEAERVAHACARSRWLPKAYRGMGESTLCTIARYRGEHALALEHLRRARTLLNKKMIQHRVLDFGEVAILINLGQVEEARACLEERREGERGEVDRLARITAELYLALAEGSHDFEEAELHEWGRYALGLTVGAPLLGLTGWAFRELGDKDMAEHLFSEAADRWHPLFDNLVPRLRPIMVPYLQRTENDEND